MSRRRSWIDDDEAVVVYLDVGPWIAMDDPALRALVPKRAPITPASPPSPVIRNPPVRRLLGKSRAVVAVVIHDRRISILECGHEVRREDKRGLRRQCPSCPWSRAEYEAEYQPRYRARRAQRNAVEIASAAE